MLSQLLVMLAISFGVFLLFFIFMGIGYMVKKLHFPMTPQIFITSCSQDKDS